MRLQLQERRREDRWEGSGMVRAAQPTFLPEPEPRQRTYTVVSADDHVVEPPHMFQARVPARFRERAPLVVHGEDGDYWTYDGEVIPNIGLNAVVGRPPAEYSREPVRFEDMRRGAWDPAARLQDMDLDGVYASLNFPSFLAGFGGGRLQATTTDDDLALAVVRAWNDWHLEEWVAANPARFIPCQIPWLADPELAAAEIRANAGRGFRAVSFPESLDHLGLPSLHSGHWDPLWEACQETGTVVCLHTGSGGTMPTTSGDAPREVTAMLFGLSAMYPAIDWLFSLVPVRFADLRIVLAESGIGWVAGMLDRLEHVSRYHECYGDWKGTELAPAEVFRRNFSFTALDDPSSFTPGTVDRIGAGNILVEVDYPHADSSWPNTQAHLAGQLGDLSPDVVEALTWKNAASLFRHPVSASVVADPASY